VCDYHIGDDYEWLSKTEAPRADHLGCPRSQTSELNPTIRSGSYASTTIAMMALIALTGCDHLQSYLCKFADVTDAP
jgi:hypothetical protein